MAVHLHTQMRLEAHKSATSKTEPEWVKKHRGRNCKLIRFGVKCDFESSGFSFSVMVSTEDFGQGSRLPECKAEPREAGCGDYGTRFPEGKTRGRW